MNYQAHRVGGAAAGIVVSTSLYDTKLNMNDPSLFIGMGIFIMSDYISSFINLNNFPYLSNVIRNILNIGLKMAGLMLIANTAIALILFGGMIGGILPDIDHPGSKIGRATKPLSIVINKLFGHRGATHSLLAALLVMYGLFMLSSFVPNDIKGFYSPFAIGISVGYVSHLILDMLTVSGIPLFLPITRKVFRIGRLKSGVHDPLVIIFIILATGIYLYQFVLY